MSMDARINVGFPFHPKTRKLIRRIGQGGAFNVICLFLWAAANRSNGDLSGMSIEDIELAADWTGCEGAFVAAMAEVRFLDGENGNYSLHGWAEHNPWAAGAEDRSEKSKWAALCKRYGQAGAAERMPDYAKHMRVACQTHAPSMPDACQADAPLPSPSPIPSLRAKSASADLCALEEKPPRPRRSVERKTRIPDDFAVSDRVRDWAARKGYDGIDRYLEPFVSKALAKGYEYVNWDEAFMGCVREDWFAIRSTGPPQNPGMTLTRPQSRTAQGLAILESMKYENPHEPRGTMVPQIDSGRSAKAAVSQT